MSDLIHRPTGNDVILDHLAGLTHGVAEGRGGRLAHALVFTGPSGVGKFRAALWWAARLKCAHHESHRVVACGDCRRIEAGTHPDVTIISPPEPEKGIGIDQIRQVLIPAMSLRPTRPGPRVGIVRDAQTMTHHAQSAALKLLEEPPGFAVLVLVSDNVSALLPTIRSRCQILRFGPLTDREVRQVLQAAGSTAFSIEAATSMARGSAARALAVTPEGVEDRLDLLSHYEALRDEGGDIETLTTELVERRKAGRPALETLLEWQVQKIEASLGCRSEAESDRLAIAFNAVACQHTGRLVEEASRMLWALRALERNGNPRLVIRDLLLDLRD